MTGDAVAAGVAGAVPGDGPARLASDSAGGSSVLQRLFSTLLEVEDLTPLMVNIDCSGSVEVSLNGWALEDVRRLSAALRVLWSPSKIRFFPERCAGGSFTVVTFGPKYPIPGECTLQWFIPDGVVLPAEWPAAVEVLD